LTVVVLVPPGATAPGDPGGVEPDCGVGDGVEDGGGVAAGEEGVAGVVDFESSMSVPGAGGGVVTAPAFVQSQGGAVLASGAAAVAAGVSPDEVNA
jgi:hypothetical protein